MAQITSCMQCYGSGIMPCATLGAHCVADAPEPVTLSVMTGHPDGPVHNVPVDVDSLPPGAYVRAACGRRAPVVWCGFRQGRPDEITCPDCYRSYNEAAKMRP